MKNYKLYINGMPAIKGQECTTFRGDKVILEDWREPHKPSSSGKVIVRDNAGDSHLYFAGVIGGEFKLEPEVTA